MDLDEIFDKLFNLIDNDNYNEFDEPQDRNLRLTNLPINYQRRGFTLLTYAIYRKKNNFISKILKSGADVNLITTNRIFIDPWLSSDIPPIVWAIFSGQTDIIDLLIQNGANLDFRNSQQQSSVHFACLDPDMLSYLIDKGIDINVVDIFGQNALFNLINSRSALILLNNGIDINQIDRDGNYAFMTCYSFECFEVIISRIIEPELLSHRNNRGLDALFIYSTLESSMPVYNYAYKTVELLLKKGAEKNRLYGSKSLLCIVNDPVMTQLLFSNGFIDHNDMSINCHLNDIITILKRSDNYLVVEDVKRLFSKLQILTYLINNTNVSANNKLLMFEQELVLKLINKINIFNEENKSKYIDLLVKFIDSLVNKGITNDENKIKPPLDELKTNNVISQSQYDKLFFAVKGINDIRTLNFPLTNFTLTNEIKLPDPKKGGYKSSNYYDLRFCFV